MLNGSMAAAELWRLRTCGNDLRFDSAVSKNLETQFPDATIYATERHRPHVAGAVAVNSILSFPYFINVSFVAWRILAVLPLCSNRKLNPHAQACREL